MGYYKNYVGQYAKRFYRPFFEEWIFKIKDYRTNDDGVEEFLYTDGKDEWWTDCEDTCIITNELPIKDVDWIANVNSKKYKGFNPFI